MFMNNNLSNCEKPLRAFSTKKFSNNEKNFGQFAAKLFI